jgi:hypothetical protein
MPAGGKVCGVPSLVVTSMGLAMTDAEEQTEIVGWA